MVGDSLSAAETTGTGRVLPELSLRRAAEQPSGPQRQAGSLWLLGGGARPVSPEHSRASIGTGLAVYGWQERDGDGLLCAVGQSAEPTSAARTDTFPSTEAILDVTLETPCLGPEAYGEPP